MDVAAARRINRRHVHPALDRGYARLSRSANRGALWFQFGALLVLLGKGKAALRGVASLAVASILANLVGKKLFGGDRPLLKDIPVGRRLHRSPTSASFPSGHAASAAGFAAGVALESPAFGAVVAPVAAAVAYSRLHTGAHWLSDVLGGLAIGAGIATIGRALVPAAPAAPQAVTPGSAVRLPSLPEGDGVFLVVNPSAGGGDRAERIAALLPGAVVHTLAEDEDFSTVVRRELSRAKRPRALGVFGGDGSVAAVAHLARGARLPLLVLPGGTANHFATTVGIDSVAAGAQALAAGTGRRVDVADAVFREGEPVTVLNTASVGIYPAFVTERERLQKRLGKRIASAVAAYRAITRAEPVDVTVDGRSVRVWSVFVGVNRYFPQSAAPYQRRRLDDGVLDVRILHAGRLSRTSGVVSLALGRTASRLLHRLRPGVRSIERFTPQEVSLLVRSGAADSPGFAHDGEASVRELRNAAAGFSATLRVAHGALDVYAPASPADADAVAGLSP